MPREKAIVKQAKQAIEDAGGYVRNIHGNRYQKGIPDLIGCVNGRMVVIECKQPGGEPTKLQEVELRKWGDAGALSMVYDGEDDLYTILSEL